VIRAEDVFTQELAMNSGKAREFGIITGGGVANEKKPSVGEIHDRADTC